MPVFVLFYNHNFDATIISFESSLNAVEFFFFVLCGFIFGVNEYSCFSLGIYLKRIVRWLSIKFLRYCYEVDKSTKF